MKKSLLSLLILNMGLLSLLTSCMRDVALDAGEDPQVVVECVMSNDRIQKLYLSFTKGASREESELLTKAVATLIDLTESKTVGQFVKGEEENLWTLHYSAVPKHRYRLEVQVPGYDLVYGEDTMPEALDISSYTFTENPIENIGFYGGPYPSFTSTAFCAGTVYVFYTLPEHTLIYGMNYNQQTGRHEIADEIFTNLPVVDKFNITENRYLPQLYKWDDETLYVNCDAVKSLYIDLKGVYKHKQYLLVEREKVKKILNQFTDNSSDAPVLYEFMVFGSFTGDWYYYKNIKFREPAPTEGYLMFESLSDNYLTYIRDAIHFMQLKESTDMSSIYLRDNIYTNIVGGLGIFAASSIQIQQCANNMMTGVLDDHFDVYGITAEGEEFSFINEDSYDYPIYNPDV